MPAAFLSTIPASTPPSPEGDVTSIGIVFFGATQYTNLPTINATGLDGGYVVPVWGSLVTTTFLP